ncbi:Uncharacterised protein [Yersinia aldovae]|uniref:hypothetical protein n=1 Tax=Yersinia aldovae TaxID=29483 RepID=UPI0005DC09F3|nr:hypothetical protein [Yersinia aldovae]CNH91501.1 Uncharacterised protein [Yersinia aldovae]
MPRITAGNRSATPPSPPPPSSATDKPLVSSNIKKVKQKLTSFLHKSAGHKPADIAVQTTQNHAGQLDTKSAGSVSKELQCWLQNYIDIDTPKNKKNHTGYLINDIKDLKQYIAVENIAGEHIVQIKAVPAQPEKIADLINQLLKGHSKKGSLYRELEKVMTEKSILGKLLHVDRASNIVTKIARVIGCKDIKIEVRSNQTTASPAKEPEQINTVVPTPEAVPTQAEIDKLKADIVIKYNAFIELARRDKLSQRLLLMHTRLYGDSLSKVQTNKPVLALSKDNMLLGDYAKLELNRQKIIDCSNIHNQQFQQNMDLLPTTETKKLSLLSLSDNVQPIIRQAVNSLNLNTPKSLWGRFISFISPTQYAKQQENSQRARNKLINLQELVNQFKSTQGFEHVGKAPWLHDMVRSLLIQAKPEKYSVKCFKLHINLPSPERKAWETKLKAWGC